MLPVIHTRAHKMVGLCFYDHTKGSLEMTLSPPPSPCAKAQLQRYIRQLVASKSLVNSQPVREFLEISPFSFAEVWSDGSFVL